jgi:hypothetical protein
MKYKYNDICLFTHNLPNKYEINKINQTKLKQKKASRQKKNNLNNAYRIASQEESIRMTTLPSPATGLPGQTPPDIDCDSSAPYNVD